MPPVPDSDLPPLRPRPLVSKEETDALMASMGFAPVKLLHNGMADGGYYAYLHPVTGVLAHDLHDENVVWLPGTDGLAVIDPGEPPKKHCVRGWKRL